MGSYRHAGLFLVLSLFWGASFMAIRVGLRDIPPVLFAAIRYDVAAVLMLAYAAAATDDWRPRTRTDWTGVVVSGLLIIACYNAFLFVGQQRVTSGVAAILIAMNPILATGFSRALLPDERLTLLGLGGLALGFVGVGLVATPGASGLVGADVIYPGFVLLAAVCVALGSVLVQRVDSGISAEGMVAWSTALGALVLHATSVWLPSESVAAVAVTTEAILSVGYLAVFASAIGYVIYFHLLGELGAIEINLVSYAVPVFAALSGWVVLGETLTASAVAGFLLIFVGFVVIKREAIATEVRLLG
ncbi:MAG: DMT family transporter [Natrialbaceae archaeon]